MDFTNTQINTSKEKKFQFSADRNLANIYTSQAQDKIAGHSELSELD